MSYGKRYRGGRMPLGCMILLVIMFFQFILAGIVLYGVFLFLRFSVRVFMARFPSARQRERLAHRQYMSALPQSARRLHQRSTILPVALLYAATVFVAIIAFLFLGLHVGPLVTLGTILIVVATILLLTVTIFLAAADWHNFITLHGVIPWMSLWRSGPGGWMLALLLMSLLLGNGLILLLPPVYLAQAWRMAPEVRRLEHQRVLARIAQLEREMQHWQPPV